MRKRFSLIFAAILALCIGALIACGDKPEAPTPLVAPVLTLDGSVVSWAAVAHATGYEVYIDGDKAATVTETRYELNITAAGRYEITVRAVTAEDGYESSAASAAVVYTVTVATTEKLDAPVLSISGNAVTWTGYEVYVNGDKAATLTVAEYVLDATEDGTYVVTVRAVSTDAGYTPSDLSAEVVYVLNSAAEPLDAPVPTADGDTVSWAAVDNAVAYAVYIDGERAAVVTATSYTVAGIAAGGA